jgi:hypothetical protein
MQVYDKRRSVQQALGVASRMESLLPEPLMIVGADGKIVQNSLVQ